MLKTLTKIVLTLLLFGNLTFQVSSPESSEKFRSPDSSVFRVTKLDNASVSVVMASSVRSSKPLAYSRCGNGFEDVFRVPSDCFSLKESTGVEIFQGLTIKFEETQRLSRVVYDKASANIVRIKNRVSLPRNTQFIFAERIDGSLSNSDTLFHLQSNFVESNQSQVFRKTVYSLAQLQNYRC